MFSADLSPGKGEGVLRSLLKGPSPLLVSRQVASTSGVGRAHGPPPPSSPPPSSGAAARPAGQGYAAHPPRCVLQPPRPTRTPCGAGTRGTGTPPFSRSRRRGGPKTRRAAQLEPGTGSGTQLGAQRAGWAPQRQQQAGPGLLGDRPCVASWEEVTRDQQGRDWIEQGRLPHSLS